MQHNPRAFVVLALGSYFGAPQVEAQTLLVTSRFTDEVLAYDLATGLSAGAFVSASLDNPVGVSFGPDGQLYVASADDNRIARFDGATGAFLGDVVTGAPVDAPRDLAFGPDGSLFVGNGGTNEVLRFDVATGALIARYGGGGLVGPTGFTFDAAGDLWVGGVLSGRVYRFDVATGALLEQRTNGLLRGPHDLSLGPDGWIYVTNAFAGAPRVVRFDPAPGGVFQAYAPGAGLVSPLGMQWTSAGALLVANQGDDEVVLLSGPTSPVESLVVASGAGGLDGPLYLALRSATPGPTMIAPAAQSVGSSVVFAIEGLTPGGPVRAWYGLGGVALGAQPNIGCPGLWLDLRAPRPLLSRPADGSGQAVVWRDVPPVLAGSTLALQAVDLATCTRTGVVRLVL